MRNIFLTTINLVVGMCVVLALSGRAAVALPFSSPAPVTNDVEVGRSLVQRVHGWHCAKRYGWVRHRHGSKIHSHRRSHRHGRACVRYYDDAYYRAPYIYYGTPRYYRPRIRWRRIYRGRRLYKRRANRAKWKKLGGRKWKKRGK